jgi:hypothetical protein
MSQNIPDLTQKDVAAQQEAKVVGQVMQAFIANIRAESIKPVLAKYGLTTIEPDQWYPQSLFADIYNELEKEGQGQNIVAIGMKTLDTLEFPEGTDSIMTALQVLPAMYQQIHQGIAADEGWRIEQVSDQHIRVTFNSPYSDYAAYGYLYSIARRFRPQGSDFTVRPQTFATGAPAVFNIEWH